MLIVFLSVDFRLGATRAGLPRLKTPPAREYHYRGGSALRLSTRAHIGHLRPRVIAGSFILQPHDIILMETLPI